MAELPCALVEGGALLLVPQSEILHLEQPGTGSPGFTPSKLELIGICWDLQTFPPCWEVCVGLQEGEAASFALSHWRLICSAEAAELSNSYLLAVKGVFLSSALLHWVQSPAGSPCSSHSSGTAAAPEPSGSLRGVWEHLLPELVSLAQTAHCQLILASCSLWCLERVEKLY